MAAPDKVKEIVAAHVIRPIAAFIQSQASGGLLLMGLTLVALVWANSTWGDTYQDLWHIEFALQFGGQSLSLSLHEWINDGLMAVFFLLVGLEIKREVLVGELATPKLAALPIMAAIGGMLVPALIYALVNRGQPTMSGWAVPMATDIAFSLGVLALLGTRAPLALKVFLTALAIVDDLGAVLVIAIFYSGELDFTALSTAGLMMLALIVMNFLGVRKLTPYLLIGFVMWLTMLQSGIHAAIAGVLLAMTIPTRIRMNVPEFLARSRDLVSRFERLPRDETGLLNEGETTTLHAIEKAVEGVQMPLQRLEATLHTPVNFVIMPIFALANAGIVLSGVGLSQVMEPVTLGVALGLILGKAVGITLFSWIGVKIGIAVLPQRVRWKQIAGVACLGGIGFTMSLFIAGLAFTDESHLVGAKLGILLGSLVSALLGVLLITKVKRPWTASSVESE
jgi:NhaA family Na+:H+ antiporter